MSAVTGEGDRPSRNLPATRFETRKDSTMETTRPTCGCNRPIDPIPETGAGATPRCECGHPREKTRTACKACLRIRSWARSMRNNSGERLRWLERRCERIARSGRRSWLCACGNPLEPRQKRCGECSRVATWARSMRDGGGRKFRSIQVWAERIVRDNVRSWLCRCGAELPDARNCRHCARCARLRRWAREHSLEKTRLFAERMEYARENGDWLCAACGSYQGPAEDVCCTECGCNVTTGEPGIATALASPRVADMSDDEHGFVVWNGSSPVSLAGGWSVDSHIAGLIALESDRRQYRIDRRMW